MARPKSPRSDGCRAASGTRRSYGVSEVAIHDAKATGRRSTHLSEGKPAACGVYLLPGLRHVSTAYRGQSIPAAHFADLRERAWPFGWLGLLLADAAGQSGAYLCAPSAGVCIVQSTLTDPQPRYYLRVPLSDKVEAWSDERSWQELKSRLPEELASRLVTGHSLEKHCPPRASSWSRCNMGGCSWWGMRRIVPPTGAKGIKSGGIGRELSVADSARILPSWPQRSAGGLLGNWRWIGSGKGNALAGL